MIRSSSMCEFKVFLDGEKMMEDVIVVEAYEQEVMLRDVLGETKVFKDVSIVEVNVPATRLVLKRN